MAAAPAAQAAVIYSQTFDTDTSDLLGTYGFILATWDAGGSYTASGGKAVMSGMGSSGGRMIHTLAAPYAYDWSNPMTLSADLSTTALDFNKSYGLWMNNLGYARNVGALMTNGRGGDNSGNNQITGLLDYENGIDDGAGFSIAITVRQNVDNTNNFDVLFQVNDVDQGIGWYTGLSKNAYGLDGNISTLGVYGDGTTTGGVFTLDNPTLSVFPEPASLGLLGAAAAAMLLRRRFRG